MKTARVSPGRAAEMATKHAAELRGSTKSFRVALDTKDCTGEDWDRWRGTDIVDTDIRSRGDASGVRETWIVRARTQAVAMTKVESAIRAAGCAGMIRIDEIEER